MSWKSICFLASAAFFPIPPDHGPGLSLRAVNLVPIRELVRSFGYLSQGQIIRQHGGNILLLAPFTLLGPAVWPRLRAWRWALAIGIGASAACDGQILVMEDMLGLSPRVPKFVKEFGEVGKAIAKAISSYADEVRARTFPLPENTYDVKD